MIKKLSVFLETGLQRRLDKDPKFRESKELQSALAFPGQLVGELMIGLHRQMKRKEVPFPNIKGKCFLPATASSKRIDDCFAKANRVEATISQYMEGYVCVEIRLFMKGSKMWLGDVVVHFASNGTGFTSGLSTTN